MQHPGPSRSLDGCRYCVLRRKALLEGNNIAKSCSLLGTGSPGCLMPLLLLPLPTTKGMDTNSRAAALGEAVPEPSSPLLTDLHTCCDQGYP